MKWCIALLICLVLIGLPITSQAQDTEIIESAAFTTGLIALDGYVNYSVIVITGTEGLTDVAINLTLPEDATFVDVFKAPESAELIGQAEDGSIAWTVAEIPAETTLGPFTVIAEFEDQAEEDFAPPAGALATITAAEQSIEAIVPEGTLTRLAESGSITLDDKGTEGEFIQVGETGVWIFMEAATVTGPVTLTFTRLPINDDAALPGSAEATWWCTLYQIEIDPADAEFADIPIAILYPTRRTITPGLPAFEFTQLGADGTWEILPAPVETDGAIGFGSGNQLLSIHSAHALFGTDEITFAGGYVEQDNLIASTTNSYINAYNQLLPLNSLPNLVVGPPARR